MKRAVVVLTAAVLGYINAGTTSSADSTLSGTEVFDESGGSLGTVRFPTSCTEEAQGRLVLGLALLHHMNYTEAEPVFLAAADTDPECAMAYWGAAMTHVHPLWPDTILPEKLVLGQALLHKAAAATHTSEREGAYVKALSGYYEGADRREKERLKSFLAGWRSIHTNYPDDTEAALFYALALLANAAAEDKSYANQIEAGDILLSVLERVDRHPGAHHYTIHAFDFPPLAGQALDVARRYDDLAPENTHALHMTSHIFTRLGFWPESIEFNERGATAASKRTAAGEVSLHYLHALDYLAYAHLQMANDEAAKAVLGRIAELEPPYQRHSVTAYAFAAVPVRLALERHDWDAAFDVKIRWPEQVPWDEYPHLEALSYFARAMGATRIGDRAKAESAITRLAELERAAAALDVAYDWGIQVAIQRVAAESWLAYESGDVESGLELARKAAEMEATTEKNPVTPGEVLPAQELYGDMLLTAGRYRDAIDAYEKALTRSPNRFNSLYGAGQAAEAAGDRETAALFYRRLVDVSAAESRGRPELEHARAYLKNSA